MAGSPRWSGERAPLGRPNGSPGYGAEELGVAAGTFPTKPRGLPPGSHDSFMPAAAGSGPLIDTFLPRTPEHGTPVATGPGSATPATSPSAATASAAASLEPVPPSLASSGGGGSAAMRALTGSRGSTGMDVRPWELAFRELALLRPIGEGSFGRVSLCARRRWWACSLPAWVHAAAGCGGRPERYTCYPGTRLFTQHPTLQVYAAEWQGGTLVAVGVARWRRRQQPRRWLQFWQRHPYGRWSAGSGAGNNGAGTHGGRGWPAGEPEAPQRCAGAQWRRRCCHARARRRQAAGLLCPYSLRVHPAPPCPPLQFYGVCREPPTIVTEFCSRGSLLELLGRARAHPSAAAALTWPRRLSMVRCVCVACGAAGVQACRRAKGC